MSLPPPPGPYGSQPPAGGQPGGGQPWQSQGGGPDGPPPQASQPWQQQGGGQSGPPPEGPPSWAPQQQWSGGVPPAPPAPPRKSGGKANWILGGLAIVLAIALTAVVTVLIVRPSGGGEKSPTTSADGTKSEFASANDTGPVNIITEDPTCAAWTRISNEYAGQTKAVNWGDRDS